MPFSVHTRKHQSRIVWLICWLTWFAGSLVSYISVVFFSFIPRNDMPTENNLFWITLNCDARIYIDGFLLLYFSLQHGLHRLGLLCASFRALSQHTGCWFCLWWPVSWMCTGLSIVSFVLRTRFSELHDGLWRSSPTHQSHPSQHATRTHATTDAS